MICALVALSSFAGATAVWASGRAASPTDVHALPLGDGRVATRPTRGFVDACPGPLRPGGSQNAGPWIQGSTFDLTAKATVDGRVVWSNAAASVRTVGGRTVVSSNALPVGGFTGVFPINPSSTAYRYDRNPNSIAVQSIAWTLPVPARAASPSCLAGGPIGIALNGVPIFDALDAANRDAVAHEVQDACGGHPQQQGMYHYHAIPQCLLDRLGSSALVGYALDGYPIFGPRRANGTLYTDADLDACHGTTSTVTLNGRRVTTYHYVATLEYPYTLGCFHGTPLRLPRP